MAISDRSKHRPGIVHGHLYVVRRVGARQQERSSRFEHDDEQELSPPDFQYGIAHHRDRNGVWQPLRLYRMGFDPDYIRVGKDKPEERMQWLAIQGELP